MDENINASLKILKKTNFHMDHVGEEKSNVGKYVPLSRSDFDSSIIEKWFEMSCKNAPKRRCLHMSFIFNDYFYIYGGFDIREGRMTDLRRMKIDGSESFLWEEVETSGVIPEALSGQSSCLVGSKFFMFGGEDNRECANNNLYILDLDTLKWEKRLFIDSDIPPVLGHSLSYFQLENSLVLFGGFSKGVYKNSIYFFSLEKNQWSKIECDSPLPKGRMNHNATLIQDDLVIYAGKNESYNFDDMWKFNLLTKKWSEVKYKHSSPDEMPEARSGQSLIYHAKTNCAYIFGGKTANLQEKNDLWKFDFKTEKFSLLHDTLLEQFNNFDATQTNFLVNKTTGLKRKSVVKSLISSDSSSRQESQHLTVNLKSTNTNTKNFKKTSLNALQQARNANYEEMLLNSPSSKKMKFSLIYKMDMTDAQNLKTRVNTMLSYRNITQDIIKPSTLPQPRDGHTSTLYGDRMLVFGGDRNKFPYNDLFIFNII